MPNQKLSESLSVAIKYSGIVVVFVLIGIVLMTFGINDNGYRTVVQWPTGNTFIKFEPGLYWSLFGRTWEYPDVLTEQFTSDEAGVPISVRYQDGGKGHIHGVARLALPNDETSMLKVHKEFRSPEGIRAKIFRPTLKEAMNLTAGLMTSEEAYTAKRSDFASWAEDQFEFGTYRTVLTKTEVEVEPAQVDPDGSTTRPAVTREKDVPVIDMSTGQAQHNAPDIAQYSFGVSGFAINDWSFEQKTLDQIQTKREAEMAIITSRAQAEKAKQQEQQAVAEGKRDVAVAKYEQEVEKEEAVVVAEREKEVAVINAQRQVEVNHQNYLAQVEDVKAAGQEAEAIELRSSAEAEARSKMINADGALAQKLATFEAVNAKYAEEFGKQKWVPELTMGAGNAQAARANAAQEMIQLLTTKTARDLALDMAMKAKDE